MATALPSTRTVSASSDEAYATVAAAFDELAARNGGRQPSTRGYHELITAVHQSIVHPGASVLEIGSGPGDLLAALEPRNGVGVDVSSGMVELARKRHPELEFEVRAGEEIELGETFDYVVLSDLVPFVDDLLALFGKVAKHSHRDTRIVVHSYSQLWRPVIRVLELLHLKSRVPIRNWVAQQDVENLLQLAGLESVSTTRRILLPLRIPFISAFFNGFLANLWIVRHLCLTYWIVARVRPAEERRNLTVSVVVPAKNEAGMIERIVAETPELGAQSELIFVEGHSTDGTREEIVRQIELHPEREIRYIEQTGHGKGDAVRLAFSQARYDVLMILDADLTVRPRELPLFLAAIETGRAEFVNGSRLVYGLEPGAMRYLNLVGNRVFSIIFSALLDQPVKDTLCGTKVLERYRYEQIAAGRSYFGDFDPFGDFDLLLGAARLSLKIVDLPVRYHARNYGDTKISRFSHGWLLVKMSVFAFRKLKIQIFPAPPLMMRTGFVPAAVAASVLFVVACSVTSGGLFSHSRPGDTNRYAQIGRALVHHGQIPYRDFYDEYPPGSVPVFALPVLIWDAHYVLVFKLLMTACGIGFVVCSTWILHRLRLSYWRLAPVVLGPPLMGSVFLNRYDPLPAFTCVLALVALLRSRERLTGALLGIGTALKIYPALAVVLVARRARQLSGAASAFVIALAVLCLPFFILAPGGVGYSLETQLRRHLQVESLGSSILLALSKLGIHRVGLINGRPGSIDVGGSLADVVGTLSSVVAVVLVLLVARAYWRGADSDTRLVTAWAAAVVGFTAFGKVLSPQYLTWMLPFVPLAAGRRGLYAIGTFLVALALTQPERFAGDKGFPDQNWTVWLLLFRNGLLVATFAFLYVSLRPQATLKESGTASTF